MISKIIQKEKERQKIIIRDSTAFAGDNPEEPKPFYYSTPAKTTHKQSLINLKEYMEEILFYTEHHSDKFPIKEDIKELTEMIKKYG